MGLVRHLATPAAPQLQGRASPYREAAQVYGVHFPALRRAQIRRSSQILDWELPDQRRHASDAGTAADYVVPTAGSAGLTDPG